MTTQPETIGLSSTRLQDAYTLLNQAVRTGQIPGAALLVGRHGVPLPPHVVGSMLPGQKQSAMDARTIFLVASVTKPYTAAAAMLLVERGELTLDDRVVRFVPEFSNRGKDAVLIRHLLTHTSGLPDMLPNDREMRRLHAPLDEFTRHTCELELDFAPGTGIQYQSMGLLMLATVVERITGMSLPVYLQREFFHPLGMEDTNLGYDPDKASRIAHVHVPQEMVGQDWGWNTPYWWGLAAPWGGLFTTVADQFRWMQVFMQQRATHCDNVLSPATTAAMVRDQTTYMPSLGEAAKLSRPWGLGWGILAPGSWSGYFGLFSPGSYGHGGATGTTVWNDPERELTCVLFTTEPQTNSGRLLGRVSNMVAAAAL